MPDSENAMRLEIRASKQFLDDLDDWRIKHKPFPSRAQAIRELVAIGLKQPVKRK